MKKLIFSLVSLTFVLGTMIAVSYAWFVSSEFESPEVSGFSHAAYFASGDGKTSETAYEITHPRHMYNLAWLQYLGDFNVVKGESGDDAKTLEQQYYFKISADIDMTDYSLPPIGTTLNPFVGVLNGNGHVIRNLNTTNDFSELPNHPLNVTSISNCDIIGLFGVVGNYNDMYINISSTIPSINNLYIDNQVVTTKTVTSGTLIGLLAGYVAGQGRISNIGVHYSRMKLASGISNISTGNVTFTNISNYALIGAYDDLKVDWTDIPNIGIGGGGEGGTGTDMDFGGSLSLLEMYNRMKLIDDNGWSTPSLNVPSDVDSGTHPNSGYAMPLVVDNEVDIENDTYYSSNTAETIPSNNIGYYTGNGAKIYSKSTLNNLYTSDITFNSEDSRIIDDINIWTKTSSTSGVDYDVLVHGSSGSTTADGVDEDIVKDVLTLLNNNYDDEDNRRMYGIRLNSQTSQNGAVPINNMVVAGQTYTSTSYLPANAVWFVPQVDGYVKIVLAVMSNGRQGFSMYNFTRNKPSDSSNPYNGSLSGFTVLTQFTDDDGNVVYADGYAREMTEKRLYYFELPVKKDVEYAIAQANSNGSYLIYLDVGQNGGTGSGEGTGGGEGGSGEGTTKTGSISGIDFVYSTGTDAAGNNTLSDLLDSEYSKSNVIFIINGSASADVEIYFKRKNDSSSELKVFYLITGASNTLVLTPNYTDGVVSGALSDFS